MKNPFTSEELIVLTKKFGPDFYRDFMDACKQDGFIPQIKKEVDTFDELVFSVSIGEGVAISSQNVVRENEVKAIHIENTHHAPKYVIAYLNNPHNDCVDLFIDHIKCYFKTL